MFQLLHEVPEWTRISWRPKTKKLKYSQHGHKPNGQLEKGSTAHFNPERHLEKSHIRCVLWRANMSQLVYRLVIYVSRSALVQSNKFCATDLAHTAPHYTLLHVKTNKSHALQKHCDTSWTICHWQLVNTYLASTLFMLSYISVLLILSTNMSLYSHQCEFQQTTVSMFCLLCMSMNICSFLQSWVHLFKLLLEFKFLARR